jgi:hypothetical protein
MAGCTSRNKKRKGKESNNFTAEQEDGKVDEMNGEWLYQSRKTLNANYANLRMPRINPRKLAELTHMRHARSKTSDSSSNFGKTIMNGEFMEI